ncbi:MAG: PqqD family protein [Acidimicrobiia bacterium]|nr:PqqD family protein [Acidimicrobiia bacterium]
MTRYGIPDHVAFEMLDGEAVVLDLESGTYYSFNSVATRVLQLFADGHDDESARASLLEEFDVDEATATADLEECVTELVGRGLLRVAPDSPSEP